MMTSNSLTFSPLGRVVPQNGRSSPRRAVSCELTTPVRPRFFGGQLLNEQDLAQIVGWADDKLRLRRYLDGWGIVHGLQVQLHPEKRDHVLIQPGYALNCCGEDLIVAQPKAVDLRPYFQSYRSDCQDPEVLTETGSEQTNVMLYLQFDKKKAQRQTVMRVAETRSGVQSEYSREEETTLVLAETTTVTFDPAVAQVDRWLAQLDEGLGRVKQFQTHFAALSAAESVSPEVLGQAKQRLLQWLNDPALQHFYFAYDELCGFAPEADESGFVAGEAVAQLWQTMFYAVQDWRLAFFNRPFSDDSSRLGVPLARVDLKAISDRRGNRSAQVQAVLPIAPFRRQLQQVGLPAYLGYLNLAKFFWLTPHEARVALSQAGIKVALDVQRLDVTSYPNLETLLAADSHHWFVPLGGTVHLQVVDATQYGMGERVFGFRTS